MHHVLSLHTCEASKADLKTLLWLLPAALPCIHTTVYTFLNVPVCCVINVTPELAVNLLLQKVRPDEQQCMLTQLV